MKSTLLLLGCFIVITAGAQQKTMAGNAAANLKSSAQTMLQLFVQKKYAAYVKYIHPKVISMVGSEANMVETVKGSIGGMESQGFTFEKVSIGEPSKIVTATNELQAIVPQIIRLKSPKGHWTSTTYLVALSTDNGKTWYFVDSNGKTLAQMKSVFPNLSNQLIIPAKTQPVITP